MKKIYPVLAGLLFLSFFPLLADATTVKRTGTSVSLASDEVVEGNFYAVGNSVTITGDVEGDAVLVGGSVTSSGAVGDDMLIIGGVVSVGGTVLDDVRIVAGEVTISGDIAGSLSVAAGRVKILSTANITGDVMIYGGDVVMEGEVGGFLYGTTDSLRIDGTIISGVDVTSQNIQLGSRSVVEGNITYISNKDIVRASDAQVGGTIVRNSPTSAESTFSFRLMALSFFVLLFTTLVFYLVARPRIERFVAYPMFNQSAMLKAIIFGFVFLFLPVAIVVLLTSVLGALIGLMALLVYLLLLLVTIPLMVCVAAKVAIKALNQKHLTLIHLILGAATVIVFVHVPFIGSFMLFVLYLFTLGTILTLLFTRLRR